MSSNPSHSITSGLRRDESGAVLLVGLVFAVVSIGLIWILFQLGDTLVRQEHGNGAADAVALSVAIQHARLMNMVVLFNLVMSAILTVRVVLRVLEVAALLAAIPTFGASLAALPPLEAAYRATTPGVVTALQSLGMAAGTMILTVPGVAQGTANYIAESYRPVVDHAIATSAGQDPYGAVFGLPLEQDLLGYTECKKTGAFISDLLAYPLDKVGMGFLAKFAGKPIRKILGVGSPFFCGLGVNIEPEIPGVDDLKEQAAENCRKELESSGVDPSSPQGQQQFKLCVTKVEGPINIAEGPIADIGNQVVDGLVGLTPPTTFSTSKQWKNGDQQWGILSVVTLEETSLRETRLVSLSAFGKRSVGALPAVANRALAQAEFYYDCNSRWEEKDCDGPTEPMWNFRWRARLVPVFEESPTLEDMLEQLRPALDNEFEAAGPTPFADALKRMNRRVIH
jgi:hypothetical protein